MRRKTKQRKDGLYQASATLSGQRYVFYGATQREANKKRDEARARDEEGQQALSEKQPTGQYLAAWLKHLEEMKRIRPRSLERYQEATRHLQNIAHIPLYKLTATDIEKQYRATMVKGLSANTVRVHHTLLHRALQDAVKKGKLRRNEADLVELPRKEKREMQVLSREHVDAFLDWVVDDHLYALYLLALTTGMRQGELLGLCWRHVNLEQGTLQVAQAAYHQKIVDADGSVHRPMAFGETKNENAQRTIRLLAPAIAALHRHRSSQNAARLRAGAHWQNHDLVFCRATGIFLDPQYVIRQFRSHLKAAGLPIIRFHDLRHTAITLQLENGTNPLLVSKQAGHHSVEFTLGNYGHVTPTMEQEAIERMERVFVKKQ